MCEMLKSESMKINIISKEETFSIPELLPHRFTPKDLLGDSAKFLFESIDNNLEWTDEALDTMGESGEPLMEQMASKAFEEANASYAQYSNCPSGVCVLDRQNNLYSGCLIESAAYNPTVSPLHSALVNGIVKGLEGWDQIKHVVLVEPVGASVRHDHIIYQVLHFICPQAQYTVLHVENTENR